MKSERKRLSLCLLAACALFVTVAAFAQQAVPTDDKLLTALRQELQRSQERLQLAGQKKPYFIQYVVNDTDEASPDAVITLTVP